MVSLKLDYINTNIWNNSGLPKPAIQLNYRTNLLPVNATHSNDTRPKPEKVAPSRPITEKTFIGRQLKPQSNSESQSKVNAWLGNHQNTFINSDVGLSKSKNQVTFKTVKSYLDPSRPTTSRLSLEEKEFQKVERHFQKMTLSLSHYISSIQFITNTVLQQKFDAKKAEFQFNGIPYDEVWAYHGTNPINVMSICESNLNKINRTAYGHGYYFSEFPELSERYGQALILFKTLPGREYVGKDMHQHSPHVWPTSTFSHILPTMEKLF